MPLAAASAQSDWDVSRQGWHPLPVPGRPGIRVIAKQFGVSPMTVQNVAR
jgi:hypothetical protein